MKRTSRGAGILAVIVCGAFGQPVAAPLSFDVASVKPSAIGLTTGEGKQREKIGTSPGSLNMRNVSLRAAIQWAYEVKDFQVSAPGWLETERYDIVAKAADPAMPAQLRLMLRTLLAERFQLKLHSETKELPVYALLVARGGPKLHAAKGDRDGLSGLEVRDGGLVFQNRSMHDLAEELSGKPFSLDCPVLDRTGLNGRFDFTLKMAGNTTDMKIMMVRGDMDVQSAVRGALQELGLKLEPQKSAIETLAIDHAVKVPTGN
jgi:uncharacterized protein (TIGR03435 family)